MFEKRALVEKPEDKRPLGNPSSRWEDKIKIDWNKLNNRL
jgi:hypothetical protein